MRYRDVKEPAQGHTASKWQSQEGNGGSETGGYVANAWHSSGTQHTITVAAIITFRALVSLSEMLDFLTLVVERPKHVFSGSVSN